MRHLYTLSSIPQTQKDSLIAIAKSMERRRCNHHTLDNPLSTLSCLSSVIDPKNSGSNKAHVVVASQEEEVRRWCRGIRGVPLVYVKRSVMIMEPMAESSVSVREAIERGKFRTGLRGREFGGGAKRKREKEEEGSDAVGNKARTTEGADLGEERALKKKKMRGLKGPNPLSVKKPKIEKVDEKREDKDRNLSNTASAGPKGRHTTKVDGTTANEGPLDDAQTPSAKRKRKRKHKADAKEIGKEFVAPELDTAAGSDR